MLLTQIVGGLAITFAWALLNDLGRVARLSLHPWEDMARFSRGMLSGALTVWFIGKMHALFPF